MRNGEWKEEMRAAQAAHDDCLRGNRDFHGAGLIPEKSIDDGQVSRGPVE